MTTARGLSWRHVLVEDGGVKLANLVTLARIALIVPIAGLLLSGLHGAALGLYVIAATTDFLDGWLARQTGRTSAFGAQLDAVADNIFSLAIFAFLLLAYPGLPARHGVALVFLFGGPVLYLGLSWLLCRRLLMFHFWSAKAGAVLLFCLWPLVALSGSEILIPITAAVVGFSRLEQLAFILRGGGDLDAPHGLARIGRASRFEGRTE